MKVRLIINDCEPDDYILAMRCAKSLLRHGDSRDIVVLYQDGSEHGSRFYAKRTVLGISVKKIATP